jgi:hypothetical protein
MHHSLRILRVYHPPVNVAILSLWYQVLNHSRLDHIATLLSLKTKLDVKCLKCRAGPEGVPWVRPHRALKNRGPPSHCMLAFFLLNLSILDTNMQKTMRYRVID